MHIRANRDFWKCIVPEGEKGVAKIEKFSVTRDGSALAALRGVYVPLGDYTRLLINGGLVMSDTPKEYSDHADFFRMAKGDVLIHGLGLGCALNVVANKPQVESITVVEIEQDVIDLVAPHFQHKNIEIIHADAMTWTPPKGKRYHAVWHDIWPNICTDNLKEMGTLHRRYGRRCDWQGSWSKEECLYHRRRGSA